MFSTAALCDYLIYRGGELPDVSTPIGYHYLLAGNGLFIQAESNLFQALIPVSCCTVRGLPPLQPQVVCRFGRIPSSLLATALHDAQAAFNNEGSLIETLYFVQQQPDTHQLQLTKPTQTATATSVTTTQTAAASATVLHLHSHGTLAAFFSGQDNIDEQGFQLYGVIGRVDTKPEIRLRLGVYGVFYPLPVSAVFTPLPDGHLRDCYEQT